MLRMVVIIVLNLVLYLVMYISEPIIAALKFATIVLTIDHDLPDLISVSLHINPHT
jgi:hypothetical protein